MKRRISEVKPICLFAFYGNNEVVAVASSETTEPIIGTLRNDRGMFVHETLLSLLAAGRQQGRNPYEEFKQIARNNEMISRAQAVPAVAS